MKKWIYETARCDVKTLKNYMLDALKLLGDHDIVMTEKEHRHLLCSVLKLEMFVNQAGEELDIHE